MGALPLPLAGGVLVGAGFVAAAFAAPNVVLAALIASIPFSGYTQLLIGGLKATSTDFLLALLVLGWLIRGLGRRQLQINHGPALLGALAFFGAALLSAQAVHYFPASAAELIKWAELIVVGFYASSNLTRSGGVRVVLIALSLAGAAESLVALRQFVSGSGPEGFAIGRFARAYGDFDQPNVLGGYLATVLPFAIALAMERSKLRLVGGASALLIGAALLATLSRGAWLGSLLGLSLMGALASARARQALLRLAALSVGVLGLAAIVGLPPVLTERLAVLFENFVIFDVRTVQVDANNYSVVERMAHWQAGWAMALDHPLLGVGIGNYESAYENYYLPGWPFALGHAHNLYLNTFAETGIVGLTAFLAFTATIFVRIAQGIRRSAEGPPLRRSVCLAALAAVTAFSVHNLFDNMLVHGMAVQLGLIVGIVDAVAQGRVEAGGREEQGRADRD